MLNYKPFKIISFNNNEEEIIEAYLFNKDDKIIVVISQINDFNYSKILILNKNGNILLNIKECIKDDGNKDIIRICHTTEENFINILDIIFDLHEKSLIRK